MIFPSAEFDDAVASACHGTIEEETLADLIDLLTKAYYRLPSRRSTTGFSMDGEPVTIKPVIYCNATILEALDRQARTAPNRMLTTTTDVFGEEVLSFRGLPIYETDGIVNTESTVS